MKNLICQSACCAILLFSVLAFVPDHGHSAMHKAKPKVLVFGKTAGFHHQSIATGYIAIQQLGAENNFDVDTTSDA